MSTPNTDICLEGIIPVVAINGVNSNKTVTLTGTQILGHGSSASITSSTTATAAQVATGYITTSGSPAVTITLPTGTNLGTQLNASAGTVFDLYIDNTAGTNTATIAVNTNAVQSDWDVQLGSGTTPAVTPLTINYGTTGMARYTLMFSSATAYTFSRTA